MPLIDRIKSLFSRKGETEKKIAFLSERRAALSQQRDRSYEEITSLEQKDEELKTQFKQTNSALTRRRITSQLVQLRKDLERRQQMLQVLNQQINVVGTHLHNLELTQQGQSAKLPDSEEIASDAAAAEEMLAQLQADNELADSVGSVAHAGMSEEEQALYEELEKEAGGPQTTQVKLDHAEPESPAAQQKTPAKPSPAEPTKRRAEPEAG
jgi:chromosome segregation ATPase